MKIVDKQLGLTQLQGNLKTDAPFVFLYTKFNNYKTLSYTTLASVKLFKKHGPVS